MFPNWHRPSLMLLEQSICEAAQGIAGKFAKDSQSSKEAAEWLQAARELRFPELTEKPTKVPFPIGSWAGLTSLVALLYTYPIDVPEEQRANVWDEFSNTAFQSSRPDKDYHKKPHSPFNWNLPPIEQPHNRVHLIVGGLGHMCDNDTAGFDPIFYLHHCNVDRLLAFWEHVYPDYSAGTQGYLDIDSLTRNPFNQVSGTYMETATQQVDTNTPLMPFRKSDYTYWTSKDTQSLLFYDPQSQDGAKNKYYTYPPIEDVEILTDPTKQLSMEERNRQRA
ncbi:hypothetical protein FRC07_012859, partial [Ceratobasidium sp. 392]